MVLKKLTYFFVLIILLTCCRNQDKKNTSNVEVVDTDTQTSQTIDEKQEEKTIDVHKKYAFLEGEWTLTSLDVKYLDYDSMKFTQDEVVVSNAKVRLYFDKETLNILIADFYAIHNDGTISSKHSTRFIYFKDNVFLVEGLNHYDEELSLNIHSDSLFTYDFDEVGFKTGYFAHQVFFKGDQIPDVETVKKLMGEPKKQSY